MLMLEMVKWWYGCGWAELLARSRAHLDELADLFSVSILLRTLFAPWKRIITYPGAGLDAHLRALLDNLVSRFIGFFVRVMVLVAAGTSFGLLVILSGAQLLLWPLLPLIAVGLIVRGLL